MRKFILTNPKFEGDVTFGYNENDRLVLYENNTTMTAGNIDWLLSNLPHSSQWLKPLITSPDTKIVEVPEDLTFDRFWNLYDKKLNRLRAEPLFEKLTDGEKMQAIVRIKAYKEYCYQTSRGVADPEKYIRSKYFTTDWAKVK